MVAIEDSLLLTVPGDAFRTLLARPEVGRFFDLQSSARLRAAVLATRVSDSRHAIFGVTVRDMLGREPVTTAPGTPIREVAQVMTRHGVSAIRRIVALAELDLGPAPAPYCVVAMGSLGRLEAGLGADQDTAILIDDSGDAADAWYEQLAAALTDAMERIGFPRCPGDAMATNARWRQTVAGWRQTFRAWMDEPEPTALMEAQIFFDMRPITGDVSLYARMSADILAIAPRSPRFLAHLAASALGRTPPLGFFRNLVLDRDGAHRHTLDLKHGGIAAVVQLSRLYCLTKGLAPHNTQARITAARNAGVIGQESAENLSDAYEFICYQRVRHQARQIREGLVPDSHVDPDELSDLDKKHLRDAFGVVKTMRNALSVTYQIGFL
jgi:CBS domain-containing protein